MEFSICKLPDLVFHKGVFKTPVFISCINQMSIMNNPVNNGSGKLVIGEQGSHSLKGRFVVIIRDSLS